MSAGPPSAVSVLASVRFDLTMPLALPRRDFVPPPRVDAAVLKITRKRRPDLDPHLQRAFGSFVSRGFRGTRGTLRRNLAGLVSPAAFDAFVSREALPLDATPGDLTCTQWLSLFHLARR
jgi:16S rRNA A1518/A1519 N6-dimethyltransferase RsmA/KsgA/DIM1 with predicted DNA glycosylase/AP lyase activity